MSSSAWTAGVHWEEETDNNGTPEEVLGHPLESSSSEVEQTEEQELEVVPQ